MVSQPQQFLRVLLYQELPGRWSARSLEHDLTVEGRNLDAVLDRILQLIFAHIDFDRRHGRAPLSAFPPAPKRFWDTFNKAKPLQKVSRRSADPSLSFGPILISISDERPALDRPVRVARSERRPAFDGHRIDGTPMMPSAEWLQFPRTGRAH